ERYLPDRPSGQWYPPLRSWFAVGASGRSSRFRKLRFIVSGARRMHRRMDLLEQLLAGAEFVAVDVETNGRLGDDCELTEVGAVLVGGGELHDRFESLVRPQTPLSRGVQRLTGITQAMVDDAPEPAEVLPDVAAL